MKTKRKKVNNQKLVQFDVIKKASKGDVLSINQILKHYEGYIASLSVRKMYDEYGGIHYCVDETLRRQLETKLIKTILGFKIKR